MCTAFKTRSYTILNSSYVDRNGFSTIYYFSTPPACIFSWRTFWRAESSGCLVICSRFPMNHELALSYAKNTYSYQLLINIQFSFNALSRRSSSHLTAWAHLTTYYYIVPGSVRVALGIFSLEKSIVFRYGKLKSTGSCSEGVLHYP